MSRIPDRELATVLERSGFYCEVGGLPLGSDVVFHHRKNRGSGGKGNLDVAANLLAVHSRCHVAIHANSARYELGWMVHSNDDPALIEVRMMPGLCRRS